MPEPVATDSRPARAGWWPDVRDRLPLWLQLRCGIEPRTAIALGIALVAAVTFAAYHFWAGRPEAISPPTAHRAAAQAPAAGPASGPQAQPAPSGGPRTRRLVIDVIGKVRDPGVHRLPPGSRVEDAIEAAGGVRPGADLRGLNRARLLVDGEQIMVGGPGAPGAAGPPGQGSSAAAPGGAPGASSGTAGAGSAPGTPVSLNSATTEQLDALPGIGPVLAQHIIEFRTQKGGFTSIDQLREVNGIGDSRFADLKPLVQP
ncbi:ComEA family DNA-binding protein [Streptomyces coryli]|uniref:ComEA family DNA-binding protein n=1 Tax=Streptomyces coryli TaxID=1128680 RepID=UPI0030B8CE43